MGSAALNGDGWTDNGDGTFRIFMHSDWVGLMEYHGDSVVSLGACSYEGEPPRRTATA